MTEDEQTALGDQLYDLGMAAADNGASAHLITIAAVMAIAETHPELGQAIVRNLEGLINGPGKLSPSVVARIEICANAVAKITGAKVEKRHATQ